MSIQLHKQTLEQTKALLFVGFDGNFESSIYNFPYENSNYDYTILNNPVKALKWLTDKIAHGESLPYAIFFNAKFIHEETEYLLREIAEHEQFRYTPVIILSDSGSRTTETQMRFYGADDVYVVPVSWDNIEARIQFLDRYKPQILSYEKNQIEQFHHPFKMPLGKRLFDIVVSLLAIVILSPIWIPVAILIALEDGFPVIYTQPRAGAGFHVFRFIKFRSMYKNADKDRDNLNHMNQYGPDGKSAVFVKFQNDPRVTRVGRVIRKYSIDELPQLINILKGDMSIVGNRPLPLYEAVQLTSDEWSARFLGPAGLTGLWQVTRRGGSNMDMAERIGLDIEYAYNYSMLNDLKIILKTFTAFIQKEDV